MSCEVFINKSNGDNNPVHAKAVQVKSGISHMFHRSSLPSYKLGLVQQFIQECIQNIQNCFFCGVLVSSEFYYYAKYAVQAHI